MEANLTISLNMLECCKLCKFMNVELWITEFGNIILSFLWTRVDILLVNAITITFLFLLNNRIQIWSSIFWRLNPIHWLYSSVPNQPRYLLFSQITRQSLCILDNCTASAKEASPSKTAVEFWGHQLWLPIATKPTCPFGLKFVIIHTHRNTIQIKDRL